ncbi:hypothetical protein E3N88_41734 [Mikania micrantha]|uniref:Uncharacterized protein n=1 Tax=Mikania micrantha TaxID=192012 RepID=A0A5N6LJS3_9ASTR|nr:hypothetical protein E3N88_41734 [Mikania micrantha]
MLPPTISIQQDMTMLFGQFCTVPTSSRGGHTTRNNGAYAPRIAQDGCNSSSCSWTATICRKQSDDDDLQAHNLPLQASCEFLASIFKYGSSNGFQWVKNACSSWLGREMAGYLRVGVPPSEELWLQAYRADDLHPVLSFPTHTYRLGSLVGLRRTTWNSRQAQ